MGFFEWVNFWFRDVSVGFCWKPIGMIFGFDF